MYKKILVPLDGSELAECVIPHVETVVKGPKDCKVILFRVVPPLRLGGIESRISPAERTRLEEDSLNVAREYLEKVAKGLRSEGIKVEIDAVLGEAKEELVEYAEQNEIDLIIIATHGRSGVGRWVWGSVAERVMHASCVPVLMVRVPGCVPDFRK
jgi:nucleotide-binding universal stress UspA family protein